MRGTEFAALNAFVAVAERRNFARAAAALGLAPSTLSQTVRALEDRLGVRLLNRTTRSVSLTEAGEQLLARVRPAFGELASAVEAVNDFSRKPMGTLRLSVSTIPAHLILAPLLKKFMAAYPAITIDVTVDDASGDLVGGRFDAGIRYGRRIAKDMQLVRVSPQSRILALAAPDYLARRGAPQTPQDLQHHDCIRFRLGDGQLLPWEFGRGKKKMEVAVKGPLIVNNADLVLEAARDGAGIGYMVEAYAADDIRAGRLVPLLTDWPPAWRSYYLYYASRHQLPLPLKVFIAFLKTMNVAPDNVAY